MPAYSKSTWIFSAGIVAVLWILFLSSTNDSRKTPNEYLSNVKSALTEWKPQLGTKTSQGSKDRPLILYAYYESDYARQNLGFFLRHALHGAADFIFIFNGDTDADDLVPVERENIKVIKRANECFDLGAYAEVLMANNSTLFKKHKRFITLNASVRGPFMPYWSIDCWSDALLRKVTDKVKLSGLTYNCHTGKGHIQSSLWATDDVGMSYMLTPDGIDECFGGFNAAVAGEVRMTPWLRSNGFEVDAFEMAFHWNDGAVRRKKNNMTMLPNGKYEGDNYALTDWNIGMTVDPATIDPNPQPWDVGCGGEDSNSDKGYFGIDLSPWEIMFIKTDRDINPLMYRLATEWVDGTSYSSYEFCK